MTALPAPRLFAGPVRVRRSAAEIRRLRVRGEAGHILAAASPIALIGLMNLGLSMTDMIMIGRHDPSGFAAVMVVSDVYSIVLNFTVGFSAIVASRTAAALGARTPRQVATILRQVGLLVLLVSLAGMTVIYHAGALLAAAGVVTEAPQVTGGYARYMAGAYLFMVLFAFARHALSALAQSRIAVLAVAGALPLNVIANYACMNGVFGWAGLGVPGAGLASLLVSAGMGGLVIVYLAFAPALSRYRSGPGIDPAYEPETLLSLARPAMLMGLAGTAETGVFLFSTVVVGIAASESLIAHGLAFRGMGASYLLLAGLGQAVTLRVSYLVGRGAFQREVHAAPAIALCGAGLMLGLSALFILADAPLARWMASTIGTSDPVLIDQVAAILPLAGLALAAAIPAHIVCAWLRAKGRVLAALWIAALGNGGVGLTAVLVLASEGFGVEGIWVGLIVGSVAASALALVHVARK